MTRGWNFTAGLILLAIAVLSFAQWPTYPPFLDSYYHLAILQGFREAAGPTFHAFWEAAPEGRPHLYPPLFHLIFLPMQLLGIPPIQIARFWSCLLPVSLFASVWWVFSRTTSARLACLTLIALAIPFPFYLSCVLYPPATLSLAAGCGILLAILRKRWLAGGILLALTFWLHAGIPWLLSLSLVLFGLFEESGRKTVLKILGVGFLGALPWLLHLKNHLGLLQFHPRGEEQLLEISVAGMVLGAMGALLAWRRSTPMGRFWVAWTLGFLPMLLFYRFRFFAAEGLFSWLLLSGIALDWIAGKLPAKGKPWLLVFILVALSGLAPSLRKDASGWSLHPAESTWTTLAGLRPSSSGGREKPLYNERHMKELADVVRSHTAPDELIYCNLPYVGGMLSVLTGRATTNQMLRELQERPEEKQIRSARLIVWIAKPFPHAKMSAEEVILQYHLRPLGKTGLARIFINPHPQGRRQVTDPFVPWWAAYGLILLAVGIVVWDLKRQ